MALVLSEMTASNRMSSSRAMPPAVGDAEPSTTASGSNWDADVMQQIITVKELIPIVLACAVWGEDWKQKVVLARCDNMAVVFDINKGHRKESEVMFLLRCLHIFTAQYDIWLTAMHIPGIHNEMADDLFHNRLHSFEARHPAADQDPTPIPHPLQQLVLLSKTDWLQTNWSDLFSSM